MKNARHERILEIIKNNVITKQEQIVDCLNSDGFNVTQATVSRDMKELRLVKILSDGEYKYVTSYAGGGKMQIIPKYISIIKETVKSAERVGNLVVVSCHSGMANAAAESIDVSNMPGIAGTIAGDNMFLVITRSDSDAEVFIDELKQLNSRI